MNANLLILHSLLLPLLLLLLVKPSSTTFVGNGPHAHLLSTRSSGETKSEEEGQGQCSSNSRTFKVICYVPLWMLDGIADNPFNEFFMDPFQCGYIGIAYFSVAKDPWTLREGSFQHELRKKRFVAHLVSLKKVNPSLRILLAIGGYADNLEREKYTELMSHKSNTEEFGRNVIELLEELGGDGVDFQLMFPGKGRERMAAADRELLAQFASTFCPLLQKEAFICKISLVRPMEEVEEGQLPQLDPFRTILNVADLVGLWTEDIPPASTAFSEIWHTDNLLPPPKELNIPNTDKITKYSMDYFVRFFVDTVLSHLAKDEPAYKKTLAKLILTIPFQSNGFDIRNYGEWSSPWAEVGSTGVVPKPPPFGSKANGFAEYLITYTFSKACTNVFRPYESQHRLYFGSMYEGSSPVAYNQEILIPVNDPDSVQKKVRYAGRVGLGGVALIQLGSDDVLGWCYNRSFPLLNAALDVLGECRQF